MDQELGLNQCSLHKGINRIKSPTMEDETLKFWGKYLLFTKTENDQGKLLCILYEGPPTVNGSPGHHVLERTKLLRIPLHVHLPVDRTPQLKCHLSYPAV